MRLIALLVIVVAAFALRVWDLDRTSLWHDEAISWNQANRAFWDVLVATTRDNYPPLHNIILYAVITLVGESENALRAPSVLLGTATVPMIYLLGRRLYDERVGLVCASLCAMSAFLVWYSQEARMYALFAFFTAFYLVSLIRVLDGPGRTTAILHVLAGLGLLHSHIYAMFTITGAGLAVLLVAFLRPSQFRLPTRRWIGLQVLIALGFAPWAYFLVERWIQLQGGFWISEPSVDVLWEVATRLMGSQIGATCLVAMMVAALFRLATSTHTNPDRDPTLLVIRLPLHLELRWREILLLSATFTPIAIAYVISLVSQPILFNHYLIGATIPALVLASSGLVRLGRNAIGIIAIVAILAGLGAKDLLYQITERERDDWRSAVAYFRDNRTDDPIFAYKRWNRSPVAYYLRNEPVRVRSIRERNLFERLKAGDQSMWLFLGYNDEQHLDAIEAFADRRLYLARRATFHRTRVLHVVPRVVRVPERSN